MAEFVALPIFDEDGRETGRLLKVDTRHFLGEASAEFAHRHIKVVTKNSMYEVEMLDRIVSGLKPQKLEDDLIPDPFAMNQQHIQSLIEGDWNFESNKAAILDDRWRPIPGYSRYEMSRHKMVATEVDGKSVAKVTGGSLDSVLLSDDNGVTRRMSIEHLFRQTFPELA